MLYYTLYYIILHYYIIYYILYIVYYILLYIYIYYYYILYYTLLLYLILYYTLLFFSSPSHPNLSSVLLHIPLSFLPFFSSSLPSQSFPSSSSIPSFPFPSISRSSYLPPYQYSLPNLLPLSLSPFPSSAIFFPSDLSSSFKVYVSGFIVRYLYLLGG